VARAWH